MEIVLSNEDVESAIRGKLDPFDLIVKRFKEDHNLNFTKKEVKDESKFKYFESNCSKFSKIIYLGEMKN